MSGRPGKDEYYMNIAKAVAQRSTCLKRRYGVVIVKNDEIIATGYNGNPRGTKNCCDTGYCNRLNKPHNSGDYSDCGSVHAEQNAMISASRKDMIGSTIYLYGDEAKSHEYEGDRIKSTWYEEISFPAPCPICHRMLQNSGISELITKGNIDTYMTTIL